MKGVTIAILIAFIAFVIALISLTLEYFQILEIEISILNLSDFFPVSNFWNY
jgi:hypothetical protein